MRAFVLVSLTTVLASGSGRAQSAALPSQSVDSATRAQLWAARDSVWRAWFAGDSLSLSHLLPNALAAGSANGGGWETREATMAAARQFAAGGGKLIALRFDSTSVRLRGSVAVMQSRYDLTLEQGGERVTRTGIATEVFVRTPGGWQNPFWYLE